MALVRAGIPDATADYLRSRSDPRSELAIEIINDVGDVRRQIELAAERETSQSRYLGRAVSLEAFRASQPTDLKGLARGVRQRTLLSVAALDDPEVYAGYEGLVALGEQVRTLPEVPTQMLIFDEIMAVLPVDPSDSSAGAIFIRVPSVVSTLAYFFDRLWVDGDPIFERAEDRLAPSGRGARVLELLAVGTKDERIARLLGIGVRTIRRDVAGLKKMLGVSSRTEIVAAAIRKGWL
jgi:DNA-binding CsgD family transcriptional regulator